MEIHRGPFDVIVDDRRVGSVEDRKTFETAIDPGDHTLRVRTGRWTSHTASFHAAEDGVLAFRCHGRRVWPILLASLFVPRLALKLTAE